MHIQARLNADIPSDWHVKESLTLLAPDGGANVIFSSEPLGPTVTSEQYALVQETLLSKEFPDYRPLDFGEAELLGGRRCFLRRFQWRPPDSGVVNQMQLYYAEAGRGYTATATVPAADLARYESLLLEILEGLRVDWATSVRV